MSSERSTGTSLDVLLGHVLRAGVGLSAAVVMLGAGLHLARHAHETPRYSVFLGEPANLRTVRGIVGTASSWDGPAVVQFGLLLLIATPIARVLFSVVGFVRQRDWLYVAITAVVLGLLLYSLTSV